jgi:sterol desaturase/sphingolipid hydroxylase (fatty acid hydroxylase superfamily)
MRTASHIPLRTWPIGGPIRERFHRLHHHVLPAGIRLAAALILLDAFKGTY